MELWSHSLCPACGKVPLASPAPFLGQRRAQNIEFRPPLRGTNDFTEIGKVGGISQQTEILEHPPLCPELTIQSHDGELTQVSQKRTGQPGALGRLGTVAVLGHCNMTVTHTVSPALPASPPHLSFSAQNVLPSLPVPLLS